MTLAHLTLARVAIAAVCLGGLLCVGQFGVAWLAPALVGATLAAYGIDRLVKARSARSWVPVRGEILQTTIGARYVGNSIRYRYFPLVHFTYSTPSGKLTSRLFTPLDNDHAHYERKLAENLAAGYSPGDTVTVYMNPERTAQASSHRVISSARRNHLLAVTLGGLIVFSATLFAAFKLQP